MTDTRKAMEQALEALTGIYVGNMTSLAEGSWRIAIETLRSALAQPEDKDLLTIAAMDAYQMGKRDALALQGEPVAGWKLVPIEPTFDQIMAAAKAAKQYMDECGGNSPTVIYQAMVAAAPAPAPQSVQTEPDAIYHRDRNCWTINRAPAGNDINFYLAPSTPQPETRKVIEQMVGALENHDGNHAASMTCVKSVDTAIQAGQQWLEEHKHA